MAELYVYVCIYGVFTVHEWDLINAAEIQNEENGPAILFKD